MRAFADALAPERERSSLTITAGIAWQETRRIVSEPQRLYKGVLGKREVTQRSGLERERERGKTASRKLFVFRGDWRILGAADSSGGGREEAFL